jgi:prepilin signal peptidase PulO-like enzyme (type II secretory pathway)
VAKTVNMNLIKEIKKDSNRLFTTFVFLVIPAILTRRIPVLSFIALAPLFAMVDHPQSFRSSYRIILATLASTLIFYFFIQEKSILNITLYSTLVIALFWTFTEIQHARQNILNKFMLVILMLGNTTKRFCS